MTSEAGDTGSLVARALMARMASVIQHAQQVQQRVDPPPAIPVEDDAHWTGLPYRRGSIVRWRPSLRRPRRGWQGATDRAALGTVRARRADGGVSVDFGPVLGVACDVTEVVADDVALQIRPGVLVHVKHSVTMPMFGWGNVNNRTVGMVREVNSEGEAEVDFVEAPGGWRCLVLELDPVPLHDAAEVSRRGLHAEAVVGLYSFPIGAAVGVKAAVVEPRHQWGPVRPGSVGRVAGVNSATAQLLVNFPEADHWRAHPEDIEVVPWADRVRVGARVRVRPTVARPRYDWPDGVTHLSTGEVVSLTHDGRVLTTFAGSAFPDRPFVFQLKELEPDGWADSAAAAEAASNVQAALATLAAAQPSTAVAASAAEASPGVVPSPARGALSRSAAARAACAAAAATGTQTAAQSSAVLAAAAPFGGDVLGGGVLGGGVGNGSAFDGPSLRSGGLRPPPCQPAVARVVCFPEDSVLGVLCPITLDVMRDPVVAADGETYERVAIEAHYASAAEHGKPAKSPLTNAEVDVRLVPNRSMQRLIVERQRVNALGAQTVAAVASAAAETAVATIHSVAASPMAAGRVDGASLPQSGRVQSAGQGRKRKAPLDTASLSLLGEVAAAVGQRERRPRATAAAAVARAAMPPPPSRGPPPTAREERARVPKSK